MACAGILMYPGNLSLPRTAPRSALHTIIWTEAFRLQMQMPLKPTSVPESMQIESVVLSGREEYKGEAGNGVSPCSGLIQNAHWPHAMST